MMKNLIYVLMICIIMFVSCNDMLSNKNSKNKIKLPSKELIQKRQKEFSQFHNKLIHSVKNTNKISDLEEYLSQSFVYYVSDYVEGKQKIRIKIEDENSLKKLDENIDFSEIVYVLINGNADVASKSATISYFSKNSSYPTIDFRYNEKSHKWKIRAIRYYEE